MLKIGDFSRFAQVSVRLLRHYDQLGLLKPAQVDEQSGYRYYSAQQLSELNHILAMRDLGLSLEQIANLLRQKRTPGHLLEMLRWKQDELETLVAAETARLARLRSLIARLEHDGSLHFDIVAKRVPACSAASVERVIPVAENISSSLRNLIHDAMQEAQRCGRAASGPAILVFQDREFRDTDIHVQALIPVREQTAHRAETGQGRYTPARAEEGGSPSARRCIDIPSISLVASTVLPSSKGDVRAAYSALLTYIEQNGYRVNGSVRELYLPASDDPMEMGVAEIQIPVEPESQPELAGSEAPGRVREHESAYRHLGRWHNGEQLARDLSDLLSWPHTTSRELS